ncbi:MAG TPA: DnaB-like helicase N-terminal domain-containing protein, partial [Spirochaetota bacterium]|nr:DnaB-like helicase N-terminal domain-containing protein [Spirochaetota bacterium]
MAQGNIPPQDIEAEASCLASILLSREALLKIIGILQPEDFYLDSHRLVYETVLELDKKNAPIDLITLKERLKDQGRFDRAGGDRGLVELYQTSSTSANA